MDKVISIKSLDKASRFFYSTKIKKICTHPFRIVNLYVLRLISFLFKRSFRVMSRTFWGDEMLVIVPEVVSSSIYLYGFHEEDLSRIALEYLIPGMTVIDIGAHFGYFTMLASAIVGEAGRVHSFEPTPSTLEILKCNAHGRGNVIVNGKAVFSRQCKVSINDYGIKYSAFNSIYEARLSKNLMTNIRPKRYDIDAVSLDDYTAARVVKPDLIKIDAESAEKEVMAGAAKTIDLYKPALIVELGDLDVKGSAKSKDLIDMLTGYGYRPYEYKDGSVKAHEPYGKAYAVSNMLFLYDK